MSKSNIKTALWLGGAWICIAIGIAAMAWATDFSIVTDPAWLKAWVFFMALLTTAPSAMFCIYKAGFMGRL